MLVMMMMAGAVLAAAPIGQAAPAQATATKPIVDPDKKVCRREVATGSVMAKSVCHTRAQWAAIDGDDKKFRDNFDGQANNPGLLTR